QTGKLHSEFRLEIQLRKFRLCTLPDGRVNHCGVFTRSEILSRRAEQRYKITGIYEAGLDNSPNIIDETEHPDYRRWHNAASFSLVIERHVAGNNGRVECLASCRHAVNNLREGPHHFRAFRRSEVQAVRD